MGFSSTIQNLNAIGSIDSIGSTFIYTLTFAITFIIVYLWLRKHKQKLSKESTGVISIITSFVVALVVQILASLQYAGISIAGWIGQYFGGTIVLLLSLLTLLLFAEVIYVIFLIIRRSIREYLSVSQSDANRT